MSPNQLNVIKKMKQGQKLIFFADHITKKIRYRLGNEYPNIRTINSLIEKGLFVYKDNETLELKEYARLHRYIR